MKAFLFSFGLLLLTVNVSFAGDVAKSANEVRPILVGDKVPNVVVHTVDGKPFELAKSVAEQKSVIVFYRGGWCPYCNLHLSS